MDRNRNDPPADAFQVNLNRLDRLFLFLLFFLVFFFFRLLPRCLGVGGFLFVFFLILLFVRSFFFIALGLERRSLVGLQRDRENAVRGVVVVALVELPDAGVKISRRNEVKVLPAWIENRIGIVVETPGNLGNFLRAQRIEEYLA